MHVRTLALLAACAGIGRAAAAQTGQRATYCNPLDLDYRYNFEQENQGISYRSGADPVVVPFGGAYYLFATIADGWWRSTDLAHWEHVTPDRWLLRGVVAPAALAVRDTLFLMPATFDREPLFYTTHPETGHLAFYNRLMPFLPGARGPWDPALFHDARTDQWYLYFGSSNTYPIYGIRLDHDNHLAYEGQPQELLRLHPEQHGWERFGPDHRDTTVTPFIEGAWMTEHGGKYYLQYAAPGTEYNVYANGTYVGDGPLGPFAYAPNNPVAYKPGGFATGAGHGNTFQDVYGNYWNTGTAWVAVNWNFERRIVLNPAGFDSAGHLYASTRFGDFPHYVPTGRWSDPAELFTGWMLLSYGKPATASSVRDTFAARNVTDENARTFWVARTNHPGEWLTIDLARAFTVKAVQVDFTDYRSGIYQNDSTVYTQFALSASLDGRHWTRVADLTGERRDRPNAYIQLPVPVRARYIRYEHEHVGSRNLAISDLRVFGNGGGPAPQAPGHVTARRDADARDAMVSWEPVAGAVGYNVRWGIGPDKLYETYQVFADQGTQRALRSLDVGQDYYVAVEAFDVNGVSRLSRTIHLR
jgi:xylan 1,4-beta-xylosidase